MKLPGTVLYNQLDTLNFANETFANTEGKYVKNLHLPVQCS